MVINPLTLLVSPANQDVLSGSGSVDFLITSNTSWTVSSDQTWCNVPSSGSGDGTLTATYDENTSGITRVAQLTITVTGLPPVIVTLTQGNGVTRELNLTLFLESLFNGTSMNQAQDFVGGSIVPKYSAGIADQVTIELHSDISPFNTAYTYSNINLNTNGTLSVSTIPSSLTGSYYLVIKHRNSVETWSSTPVSFSGSGPVTYNFSSSAAQSFGDNLKQMGSVWMIYGGDISQDGTVDGSDLALIDNASTNLLQGYLSQDANGDGTADGTDMAMIDNNSTLVVHVNKP
jgi:hypothetical protein